MNVVKPELFGKLVGEFTEAFGAPKDQDLWLKLINEEADEVLKAGEELLKECCDLVYVMHGLNNLDQRTNLSPELSHKLGFALELMSLMIDYLPEGGFEDGFTRVHLSNMSKLGEDGKPIRREDGKVLKGPNYAPPILSDLIY